jgi:DnaJ-class molecular chaperone
VKVKSKPDEVIAHDQIMTLEGMGMPFFNDDEVMASSSLFGSSGKGKEQKYGNIFILFKVKFPDQIDLEHVELLKQTMQHLDGMKPKAQKVSDDVECYPLVRFENSQRNTHAQGGTEGDEEEEDNYDMMD